MVIIMKNCNGTSNEW